MLKLCWNSGSRNVPVLEELLPVHLKYAVVTKIDISLLQNKPA